MKKTNIKNLIDRSTAIGTAITVMGGLTVGLLGAPVVFAVTDSNYLAEEAQIAQEQAKDSIEAQAGINAAKAALNEVTVEPPAPAPAPEPAPAPAPEPTPAPTPSPSPAPKISPSPSPSPASTPEVLGVSTQRPNTENDSNDFKASLLTLQMQQEQMKSDHDTQNFVFVLLTLFMAFMAFMAEYRYQKISTSYFGLKARLPKNFKLRE